MRLTELMMLGLVLWTAIGAVGLTIAAVRKERHRFRRGLMTICVIWLGYMGVLVGVSLRPTMVIPPGKERCFDKMCFAVDRVEEVQGFQARGMDRERLLRVSVAVLNHGRSRPERENDLMIYLIDGQGRRWGQVRGLSGVPLTTQVGPGGRTIGEPVFRVAKDATGLRMVLQHAHWTLARLVIGDAESWLHQPVEMMLPVGR